MLLLKQEGILVNDAVLDGSTPLFIAAHNGHEKVVDLLLKSEGIKVNEVDRDGVSPLFGAVEQKHYKVVKKLLKTEDIQVRNATWYQAKKMGIFHRYKRTPYIRCTRSRCRM